MTYLCRHQDTELASCSPREGKGRQAAAKGSSRTGWALTDRHSPTEAEGCSQSWVLVTGSANSPRHCEGMNWVWGVQPVAKDMGPEIRLETSPHEGSIQEIHHPQQRHQVHPGGQYWRQAHLQQTQARIEGPGRCLNRASGPTAVGRGPR